MSLAPFTSTSGTVAAWNPLSDGWDPSALGATGHFMVNLFVVVIALVSLGYLWRKWRETRPSWMRENAIPNLSTFDELNTVESPTAPVETPKVPKSWIEPVDVLIASRWKKANLELDRAMAIIANYEIDTAKAIDFPAFNDVSVPQTSEMVKALKKASRLHDETKAQWPAVEGRTVQEFADAVDHLHVCIEIAENTAQKLRWSTLSVAEQKDLELAQNLLKQAADPGNTREARTTYYRKLQKVVRKLNKGHGATLIPVQAMAAIERAARRQIEGPDTVMANNGQQTSSTFDPTPTR